MKTKTFEVRDRMTFIPVLAVKLDPTCEAERYLLARSGYGRLPDEQSKYILLVKLSGGNGPARCDPFEWDGRTMRAAHTFIEVHFDEMETGEVVDAEFILGEKKEPAISDALESGNV